METGAGMDGTDSTGVNVWQTNLEEFRDDRMQINIHQHQARKDPNLALKRRSLEAAELVTQPCLEANYGSAQLEMKTKEVASLKAQLNEAALQMHNYRGQITQFQDQVVSLQSRVNELTTGISNREATIKKYKEKLDVGTSQVIELEVRKDELQQELELSKQRQDGLKEQLVIIKDQVSTLLTQRAAMMTAFEEQVISTTKTTMDNTWANFQNSFDVTHSHRSLIAPVVDHLEPEAGPSTSTSMVTTVIYKRKANHVEENSSEDPQRKRGREADEEIVIKIEGCTVGGVRDHDDGNVNDAPHEVVIVPQIEGVELSTEVFGNDKILSNIIKYLPAKKLPELRNTCKTWNSAIIKELIRKVHTELEFAQNTQDSGSNPISKKYGKSLNDFVEIMRRSEDIPFSRYHISSISYSEDCDFFTICGKSITKLKISLQDPNVFTLDNFCNLIFKLAPLLLELSVIDNRSVDRVLTQEFISAQEQHRHQKLMLNRLSIVTMFPTDLSYRKRFMEFLTQVFKTAEKLESVDFKQNKQQNQSRWNDVNFEVLLAIEKTANLNSLKSLRLYNVSKQDLKVLVRLSSKKENALKLSSFDTSCINRRSAVHFLDIQLRLNQFLKLQAASLQKLTVRFDYNEPLKSLLTIVLPKMNKLKELTFSVDKCLKDTIIQFESLSNNFPNLKMFEYRHKDGLVSHDDWIKYINHPRTHLGIEDLKVTVHIFSFTKRLTQLASMFPNVRKLAVELTSLDTLGHMWNLWTQLESLHIFFRIRNPWNPGKKSDTLKLNAYLTGVPSKNHAALILKMASSAELNLLDLNEVKTGPGISDLQNLRELTLDFTDSIAPSECISVSDLSVDCGLSLIRRLRTLRIFPARLISPRCRERLSHVLES